MGLTCVAHASCLFAARRHWSTVWPGSCRDHWWFPGTAFFNWELYTQNRTTIREKTEETRPTDQSAYIKRARDKWLSRLSRADFIEEFKRELKKTWTRMSLPMVLVTHKRDDQSANVVLAAHTGCLRGTRTDAEGEVETCMMITRYRASGPIIVICFDNDVDVGEARNLARRNIGMIFHSWRINWLSLSRWI